MEADSLLKLVIQYLEDIKAQHIVTINVSERTSVTDYMVIANGTSSRHVQAVADSVAEKVKQQGITPLGSEGRGQSDWVLIDLGDVVLHVMTAQAREFYDLERLWGEPALALEAE